MPNRAKESLVRRRVDRAQCHGLDTRLLDSLPDACILTDVAGTILYWNASATRLFGWTAEEMVGQPYASRYPEPMRGWIQQEITKRAQGSDWEGEFQDLRRDGSYVWIYACVSRILNDAGEPVAVLGISHDITRRKQTEAELIESQRRLDEAQRIAHLASWIWDPNTQQVWWSDGIYDLFGIDKGSVQPSFDAFLDLLHPDDRELALQRAEAVHSGNTTVAHDLRLIRPDGKQIWIHSRSRATRDEQGNIIRVEGTDQNITERKLAEQALKESEARYRSLVEGLFDGLIIQDADGRIVDVNPQLCKQLGYSRDELIGRYSDFFDPSLTRKDASEIAVLQRNNSRICCETTHRHRDGHLFPVEVRRRTFPMLGANRSLSVVRDLTESRQASEERDRLWNNSPDLLVIADRTGCIRQLNPAWKRISGWDNQRLIGQTLHSLIHPDDEQMFIDSLNQLISVSASNTVAQQPSTTTIRLRCSDGSYRWFSWNAIYVSASQTVCGFARDVTQQKLLEEKFQQAQKMEAIGQLAGGVAHDFNNLLTVIRSYTDLLLARNSMWDETVEQLCAIREASERAAGLTAQLLAFSRKAIIEPKVIDLNNSVDSAARLLRRLIGEDIQLITRLSPDLWKTTIDPVQLEQTLMNLAVNARDAMPRGGMLSIATINVQLPDSRWPETAACKSGPYVQLCFSDNGNGMSDEVKRHLFEPFFTTKGAGKGTGLGLATVYGIIHQAGGVIGVESDLGRGTLFRIFLPAVVNTPSLGDLPCPADVARGHETVLLVEDEQAVRRLAQLILEMHGYKVIAASCGAEAITLAQTYDGDIDLLLSDVVMPDLPGRELAEKLRQMRQSLRILYMSGYTNDALVRNGVASATDAFLPKPFTPNSLTQKVREALDAK